MIQIKDTKSEMVLLEQTSNILIVQKGQMLEDEVIKQRFKLFRRSILIQICIFTILAIIIISVSNNIYRDGFALATAIFMFSIKSIIDFAELFKSFCENWTFDRVNGKLIQTSSNYFKNKVIQYPLSDFVDVEIREQTDDSFIAYEIVLIRNSSKALSLGCSDFNIKSDEKAIARKQQENIAKSIHEFLHPDEDTLFLDNSSDDDTIL